MPSKTKLGTISPGGVIGKWPKTALRGGCLATHGELPLLLTLMRNLRIVKNMERAPMAVVETKEFLKQAKPLMSDSERADLVAGYPREA